jgi:hypothetical protein
MTNPELSKDGDLEESHYRTARSLLAQELRAYFDHRIVDEDLTPEFHLPPEFQRDRYKAVFGFSIGAGFAKKTFAISFETSQSGEPRFELIPESDPTLRILRLRGQHSTIDQGRTQIERVLAPNRKLMN